MSQPEFADRCREHENPKEDQLPYLLASLFGTILEDSITQLRILSECNNELRIYKARTEWPKLLAVKYDVRQPTSTDELAGVDPHNLHAETYKINKLDSDRKRVTSVLSETYVDLALSKSFESLERSVEATLARDRNRVRLDQEEQRNKVVRRDLHRQLRVQRNHIKRVLYDTEVTIDDLISQVEDSTLYIECKRRYIENWQRARTEQHSETIALEEREHSERIEYFKRRSDHELRVHAEVELLVNIGINETLQKIEEWMEKYDRDLENIDLKIQIKKNDYQDMRDRRVKLEETLATHGKLMVEWVSFKDERERARQYHDKMTRAALCVQAWWRGLLVRRQLGPFRPKKAPPKKK